MSSGCRITIFPCRQAAALPATHSRTLAHHKCRISSFRAVASAIGSRRLPRDSMFKDPCMPLDRYLPYDAPEAQGVASQAILAFVDAADQNIESLHSLMLLRHGHVLAEGWWAPYEPERPHMLFSLSKSFT